MAPKSQVTRGLGANLRRLSEKSPCNFLQFTGPQATEISRLVKYFLEGSMYRVEYLAKFETTTLKVYDED